MTTTKTFAKILKIHLGLCGRDLVEHNLIMRYYSKVSLRLKNRLLEIESKACEKGTRLLRQAVYTKNPFLGLIKKESNWHGKALPVPLAQGKDPKRGGVR